MSTVPNTEDELPIPPPPSEPHPHEEISDEEDQEDLEDEEDEEEEEDDEDVDDDEEDVDHPDGKRRRDNEDDDQEDEDEDDEDEEDEDVEDQDPEDEMADNKAEKEEDLEYQEVTEGDKIPVTIVTGFLGAGKTTLVNHILKGDHGLKIAVVENEFGEVSIDTDLVQQNLKAAESIVTMDNGCVCCSVRGDLIRALTELLSTGKNFDAVLIECTGLADPAPVAFTFYMNPDVSEYYKIDSILALVDAKHIKQHTSEVKPEGVVNEAVSQLAFADRILVNKTDLVSPEELEETLDLIKSINGYAEVIQCQNSNVSLAKVLGVNSFSIEKTLEVDPDFLDDPDVPAKEGEEKKKKLVHDTSGVGSVGIMLEGELDDVVFNSFMQQLLQAKARDIFRSKGVLCINGQGKTKFVFQGVHEQINFGPSLESWKEDETPMNKLVFIGRGLDREELQKGFAACKYTPLPLGWDSAMDDYGRRYYFNKETRATQWTKPTVEPEPTA